MSVLCRRLLTTLAIVVLTLAGLTTTAAARPAGATPTLQSFSVGAGPHSPGDSIPFRLALADTQDLHAVTVEVREESTGHHDGFTARWTSFPGPEGGTFDYTVSTDPETMPFADVTYLIHRVALQDTAGRSTRYYRDGTFGSETLPGATHDVDLSAELRFTNSPRDHTPPMLTALSISPLEVEAGEPVTVSYTASDEALYGVRVYGRDTRGWGVSLAMIADIPLPASGSTAWTSDTAERVSSLWVEVSDRYGNIARYYGDGRLTTGTEFYPATTVTTHSLQLPREVVVRPQGVTGLGSVTRSGSITLRWSQDPGLGHRVVISPGGRVLTGSPGSTERTATVAGLTNGVTYSFSVETTSGTVPSRAATTTATPRMTMNVFGAGDRTGDRRADLWATGFGHDSKNPGTWRLYPGAGAGTFGRTTTPTSIPATTPGFPGSTTGRGPGDDRAALLRTTAGALEEPLLSGGTRRIGTGWQGMRAIDGSSDFTGDRISDVIAVTAAGTLHRYTGTSTGGLTPGVQIGSGWGGFHAVFSPGDFNGDGRADIVGVDPGGRLWLYPGTGRGVLASKVQIGTGWGGFGSVLPLRDFSGDGKADLGAITMDGQLLMYPGNGRGGFLPRTRIGTGWQPFL